MKKIAWGIIGLGKIADKFAQTCVQWLKLNLEVQLQEARKSRRNLVICMGFMQIYECLKRTDSFAEIILESIN
ncbi:hypothetical protein acsn021_23630 [Anaerocolumna cellulosilytica]|uniref:Uncharacterized protein n=1 Tax=Anaerocolumna cellulosilytica TaxID=433286 RepID=A0A6S6QW17_9FIRM|nr:hypothetical protein [Anaerocolumna cellulosilytica]MBB5193992.1 hypothetical protein [Anaerocolumna cellulosilytica]BCJ94794.1 hypothetical protein acsn021_23630 [Anaerocolumna cellulosilytica]